MQEVNRRRTTAAPTGTATQNELLERANRRVRKRRRRQSSSNSNFCEGNIVLFLTLFTCVLISASLWLGGRLYDLWSSADGGNHHHHRHTTEQGGSGSSDGAGHQSLPWNSIYRIPDASPYVGDRSDEYARLRKEFDEGDLPLNTERSHRRVQELLLDPDYNKRIPLEVHSSDTMAYDIYDCPDTPPAGYPFAWSTMKILENWPVDETDIPEQGYHQGLCVFDYEKDLEKAMAYREAEVPFIVYNDPQVDRSVERWNSPNYMQRMLGDVMHRCEVSTNNHFMYYVPPGGGRKKKRLRNNIKVPENWTAPTEQTRMTYSEWLSHADVPKEQSTPDSKHWYFRLIGCGYMGAGGGCDKGSSEYLFDELPFFQPSPNLYIVDPEEQKGIHCRFGMRGVIAENHFDGSRNAIAVFQGSRRYILSHPDQCEHLALYPKKHPSARHSAIEWSQPDLEQYPQFRQAKSNEVVLQPGQVLYLPTDWFHFIVSLETNIQCNTRSGVSNEYKPALKQCGF